MKNVSYVAIPGLTYTNEITKEIMYSSCHQVATKICNLYGITLEILSSKRRYRNVVLPRQIYCYMCKKYVMPRPTLKLIGNFINVNHATVIHSITTVENLMSTDTEFSLIMKSIDKKFKQSNI